MLSKVSEFIQKEGLIDDSDKVLVAVSGGRDSIVLLMLLNNLKVPIEVAHCNYQLRGEESESDEKFVKGLCKKLQIPFHTNRFETVNAAKKEGISIQMKARDLRYSWFYKLVKERNLTKIATAHHLDDQLETILINLTRGTGLKGLRGMKVKRDNIVRPLLCVSRDEINDFIYANHIPFREDCSNASGKYFRNKIRHQVIPVLKEINPSLFQAINNSTKRLKAVECNWEEQYEAWKSTLKTKDNSLILPFSQIQKATITFLQQFFRSKGFSYPDIESMISTKHKGKSFYGKDNWKVVTASNQLEIFQSKEPELKEYYLDQEMPIDLTIECFENGITLQPNGNKAYINADKVQGKLKIRKWKQGDWFIPLGMNGKQKISDYFTNNKFSLKDKEDTWLLCDAEKVVWIIGHRSDNRYRVDPGTKNIYVISLQ
ncbi:MAG: tRNA lysidine(34) synthetase TilS [Flavobacteriales bacterium]|nr:tRNA lysidine(34) synthetase TilS [Flavobacteriales bacterium]|tara:strand:+ start:1092 stop:2381 length:1290 start_codon:yes stop_codon:yes gene_type:complete